MSYPSEKMLAAYTIADEELQLELDIIEEAHAAAVKAAKDKWATAIEAINAEFDASIEAWRQEQEKGIKPTPQKLMQDAMVRIQEAQANYDVLKKIAEKKENGNVNG